MILFIREFGASLANENYRQSSNFGRLSLSKIMIPNYESKGITFAGTSLTYYPFASLLTAKLFVIRKKARVTFVRAYIGLSLYVRSKVRLRISSVTCIVIVTL